MKPKIDYERFQIIKGIHDNIEYQTNEEFSVVDELIEEIDRQFKEFAEASDFDAMMDDC